VRVGLDIDKEEIFFEVVGGGVTHVVSMTARTAKAVAGQLLATAETLEEEINNGNLGVDADG